MPQVCSLKCFLVWNAALFSTGKPTPKYKQVASSCYPTCTRRHISTGFVGLQAPSNNSTQHQETYSYMKADSNFMLRYSVGARRPASPLSTETQCFPPPRGVPVPSSQSRNTCSSTEGKKAVICTTRSLCNAQYKVSGILFPEEGCWNSTTKKLTCSTWLL